VIYRLRPMVRPKNEQNEEREPRHERPASFQRRRQARQ
jgi:hypothetical protein